LAGPFINLSTEGESASGGKVDTPENPYFFTLIVIALLRKPHLLISKGSITVKVVFTLGTLFERNILPE
jgi:hypothetical protein